jgi:anthranilate synthase/aminodeoxychorismate synthase-like glutamine amidotransferase
MSAGETGSGLRLLLLDNYDSFTYNLVQYLEELGASVTVVRNDRISPAEVERQGFRAVVISPGPGRPEEAGISVELIRRVAPTTPLLGVCLGHQAIAYSLGGRIVQAPTIMHGKTSLIRHDGRTLFEGLKNPFEATRYHSLVVDPGSLPSDLEVSARTPDGVVMGIRHRTFPLEGVQFHPESVLTLEGKALLANFLRWASSRRAG